MEKLVGLEVLLDNGKPVPLIVELEIALSAEAGRGQDQDQRARAILDGFIRGIRFLEGVWTNECWAKESVAFLSKKEPCVPLRKYLSSGGEGDLRSILGLFNDDSTVH
jgi:hypothetical protein